MKKQFLNILILLMIVASCSDNKRTSEGDENHSKIPHSGPIQLHPENPHYFLYKGKPLVLITSAEHYGALINLDFDYKKYLESLAADGMNYTRIFTGTYFEIPGESFSIKYNTLAPEKNRVITPWSIIIEDLSGNFKYDLSTWNNTYFERLKDLMSIAADNNIIVEVTLFSSIYRDEHWDISPQNPENNINIKHEINRFDAQTLNNGTLIQYQEKFVRKMVQELNEYDNFFFEIQNEPWSDHPVAAINIENKEDLPGKDWRFNAHFAEESAMDWQRKITSFIVDEEKDLEKTHLIAQNYSNYKVPIPEVEENISIINFHYNWPESVVWNYSYNKVIGFDESGFAGSADIVYRRQAWRFILSGGALFNNLDYSFFNGYEDGTLINEAPGGGSAELRKQLKILSDFIHGFDVVKLKPDYSTVVQADGVIPYVLSNPGHEYALFLQAVLVDKAELVMQTTNGNYHIKHHNTQNSQVIMEETVEVVDNTLTLTVDFIDGELALEIKRK